MGHENSISIRTKRGKFVNIPTVRNGVDLSDAQARQQFERGTIKPLGGKRYGTMKDAVRAADKRSQEYRK